MANLIYRELLNYSSATQIWTITANWSGQTNCIDYDNNYSVNFWWLVQWTINHYGSTVFLLNYDISLNSFRVYNFDNISILWDEANWIRSIYIKRTNYIYKLWIPSGSNNRKMYWQRYLIGTTPNVNGVFSLTLETLTPQISSQDFLLSWVAWAFLMNMQSIKNNWFYLFYSNYNTTTLNSHITSADITFDGSNNILFNVRDIKTWVGNHGWNGRYIGNIENFLWYFRFLRSWRWTSPFASLGNNVYWKIDWSGIITITWVGLLAWMGMTLSATWQVPIFTKLSEVWKSIASSSWWSRPKYLDINYNILDAWPLLASYTNYPCWHWHVPAGWTAIFKGIITNSWASSNNGVKIDMTASAVWPVTSFNQTLQWSILMRLELLNDCYMLLNTSWTLWVIQITDAANWNQYKTTWNFISTPFVVPAWYTRMSISELVDFWIWGNTTWDYRWDWWAWQSITPLNYITIPTTPYPWTVAFRATLTTSNVTASPILDKLNILFHN